MTTILDIVHNLHLFFFLTVFQKLGSFASGVMIGKLPTLLGLLQTIMYDQSTVKKCSKHIMNNIYTLTKALLYKVQCFHSMMTQKQ